MTDLAKKKFEATFSDGKFGMLVSACVNPETFQTDGYIDEKGNKITDFQAMLDRLDKEGIMVPTIIVADPVAKGMIIETRVTPKGADKPISFDDLVCGHCGRILLGYDEEICPSCGGHNDLGGDLERIDDAQLKERFPNLEN